MYLEVKDHCMVRLAKEDVKSNLVHVLSTEATTPDAAVVGFGARVTADLISLQGEQRKQLH